MTDYTLAQAQADIAALRGQFAHLLANAEIINLLTDGSATFTNAAAIIQPGSSPAVAETWHDFPAAVNSWGNGTGGFKKYRLTVTGSVEISISLRQIGTKTDGITILSAGALPTGYRPSTAKWLPVSAHAAANSANNTPFMTFGSDGSVTITGVNTAGTLAQVDCHGVLPLI